MAKKSRNYSSIIFAALLLFSAVSLFAVFVGMPSLSSNDRQPATSAKNMDPDLFLRDINFKDGSDYILVIQVDGVVTIIAEHDVLENYSGKIRVSGMNWLAFFPGERGRPDKSIALYKDGVRLRHDTSHTTKSFEFSNITEHGVAVKYNRFYENKTETEARIAKLEMSETRQVFLVNKPDLYKESNVVLTLDLPVFWTSAAIKLADIEADLNALTDEFITPHIADENVNVTAKKLDGVRVHDNMGIDLVDDNGDPVTLDDVLSYYSPRLKISCDHVEQCQALKPKIAPFFRAIKSWRDNGLLDSIERAELPERDEDGDRLIYLGLDLHDEFWVNISENKYTLNYYEAVE